MVMQTPSSTGSQTESGTDTLTFLICTIVYPQIKYGTNSGLCNIARTRFLVGKLKCDKMEENRLAI